MNYVWVFYYNSCIHESAPSARSLHRTARGAYKAMRDDLLSRYNKWQTLRTNFGKSRDYIDKFGLHEEWFIGKLEIKD